MAHLARGARQGVMNVSLKSRIEARDRQSMFLSFSAKLDN